MTHTAGPWEWKDDDLETLGMYRLAPGILATDMTDGTPWGDEIDQANAALIAAAPDLLKALKAMVLNDRHTYRDCHKASILAISKAEGTSL